MKVLFQDDDILVLDKPAGLVVDKSNTQQTNTLEDILVNEYQIKLERGGIVHRLDKDTSGVILVAKTQAALDNLQAQFKERKTKKQYLALVHGIVEKGGIVEGAIGRNPIHREKFMVMDPSTGSGQVGKEAVTEYEPVSGYQLSALSLQTIFSEFNKIQMRKLERQDYGKFTLLNCYPKTGRTHQIRVHLKHINHPIVSDEVYGGRKIVRLDHRWCPRQFLHAKKLGFFHPKSGEWMEIEASLPEDLKEALSKLNE